MGDYADAKRTDPSVTDALARQRKPRPKGSDGSKPRARQLGEKARPKQSGVMFDAHHQASTPSDDALDVPVALPASLQTSLEATSGRSLGHVNVHTGAKGNEVATQHGARAVTIGNDIFVRDGHFEPDSEDGRSLLAHEVAHVLQADASRVGTVIAAEDEADTFAAAVRTGTRFTPNVGVTSGAAMRAPLGHDAFTAKMTYETEIAEQAHRDVTAPALLHLHTEDLRRDLRLYLDAQTFPLAPHASFAGGVAPFIAALFKAFESEDPAARITRLRSWVAPRDLYAIVDRERATSGASQPSLPKDGLDYAHGPVGTSAWTTSLALGIGQAVEERLLASLARMSKQLVTVTASHRAQGTIVTANDLVPAHPMDWEVALGMTGRGDPTIVVGPEHLATTDKVERTHKLSNFTWQGANGGPWNSLLVEPRTASIESVAATVLGDPREAYYLSKIGDYWIVDASIAAHIPAASRYALGDLKQYGVDRVFTDLRDVLQNQEHRSPVPRRDLPNAAPSATQQLAFGAHAGEVETAEVKRSVTTLQPVSTVALESSWVGVQEQLRGLQIVIRPFALDQLLNQAVERHRQHHLDLQQLSGDAAALRGAMFGQQTQLLAQIATTISALLPHAASGPARDTVAEYIEAANLSHLPETCRARMAAISSKAITQGAAPLEAELQKVTASLDAIRRLGPQATGAAKNSEHAFGSSLEVRANGLRSRVAAMRGHFMRGANSEADRMEVAAIATEVDTLLFDAAIVVEIAQLGQLFEMYEKLEESNWILFSELLRNLNDDSVGSDNRIGRLELERRGAMKFRQKLNVLHAKWLASQSTFAAQPGPLASESAAHETVKPAADQIRAELANLAGDTEVKAFLQRAVEIADDATARAQIVQLVTILGVMVASAITGNLVGAAAQAVGASATIASLTSLMADTAMFTGLNARLSGEPMLHAFITNGIGNLLTLGAMRGVKPLNIGQRLSRVLLGAKNGKATLFAVRALAASAEFSLESLVATSVQIGQLEYETLAATGKTATLAQIEQSALVGLGMMLGARVNHLVLAGSLENAGIVLGEKLFGLRSRIEGLVAHNESSENVATAMELIENAGEYAKELAQRHAELEAKSDHELGAMSITRAQIRELARQLKTVSEDVLVRNAAEVETLVALHTVVPGRVYSGSEAHVRTVASAYGRQGYRGVETPEGLHLTKQGAPTLDLFVHRDPASEHVRSQTDQGVANKERERDALRRMPVPADPTVVDAHIKGGQSGTDLHNHFLGNVEPEAFALQMELAGRGMKPGDVSKWEPLLRESVAHEELGYPRSAEKLGQRGVSGDALREVNAALRKIEKLKPATSAETRLQIETIAKDAVTKAFQATSETDFNSAYEIRDALIKDVYGVADRRAVMNDEAQISRDKDSLLAHFEGRRVVVQRIMHAVELESDPHANRTELEALRSSIKQQFAYDRYAIDTLISLAREGVTYTEQSNSLSKLQARFDPQMIEWARAKAKLAEPGLARALDKLVVKHLAMIATRSFGERGEIDRRDVTDKARFNNVQFEKEVDGLVAVAKRNDVAGIDIAGVESYEFDQVGAERFTYVYDQLAAVALERGSPIVFRPHVGEGAIDTVAGEAYGRDHNRQMTKDRSQLSHYERAEKNLEVIIKVMETIAARRENSSYGGRLPPEVIVRFGHATHATPRQVERMARLGIHVEVNLSSNQATGASATNKPARGQLDHTSPPVDSTLLADKTHSVEDHAFASLVFHEASIMVSTDGNSVMNTNLTFEFRRAKEVISSIISNDRAVEVALSDALEMNFEGGNIHIEHTEPNGKVLVRYRQMSARKQKVFAAAYRRLFENAAGYVKRFGEGTK